MGRKAKTIDLTFYEQLSLEDGYKKSKGVFSRRCHLIQGNCMKKLFLCNKNDVIRKPSFKFVLL